MTAALSATAASRLRGRLGRGPVIAPVAIALVVIALLAIPALIGCSGDRPLNPSFPLTIAEARAEWKVMTDDPRPFARPVVVLGGIYDPGLVASALARNLREITTPEPEIVTVSFLMTSDFDTCRKRAMEAVDDAWPSDDDAATVEVDVVAVSMGGLVARYAARSTPDAPRRLRIRRLFTIATPHRGARMADLPTLDDRVLEMRAGSDFLAGLNGATMPCDPEIFAYTRLGDAIVGAERTALPGRGTWWVANMPLTFAHLSVAHDPRILADIARRLRGELPYTRDPAAPLPEDR